VRGTPWPAFLPGLSVRDIYDSAEARYAPRTLSDAGVVLIRARFGEGDDTPYREIYADEAFGWDLVAPGIELLDVEGGHSSMLQEPFVESLAAALTSKLTEDGERLGGNAVATQALQTMAV
jgi:thioesterase domain-containing protein